MLERIYVAIDIGETFIKAVAMNEYASKLSIVGSTSVKTNGITNGDITIINDFSSLGKIKSLNKEIIDIYLLLDDIYLVLKPIYSKENSYITLPKSKELYIEADYNRLKQVLINILKNSLESKNKDVLYVDLKIRNYKDYVRITISDNGCGISKEQLKSIGNDFYTTKRNGTGLGLSYCNEIIKLHNGTIKYKSIVNKGTNVIISLPK